MVKELKDKYGEIIYMFYDNRDLINKNNTSNLIKKK